MQKQKTSTLIVERTILLDSVPSGSGLAVSGDKIYLVGDDSPHLFVLNQQYQVTNQYLMLQEWAGNARIPKSGKPDFESMTHATWGQEPSLLVFGSGSKSPERDSLLVLPLNNLHNPKRYSLTRLYDAIYRKEGISRDNLNLEGAVMAGKDLWLFNRGTNSIIIIDWNSLFAYINNPAPPTPLNIEVHQHQLPEIGGKQARFSGACSIPGTSLILFTASVEDTENWIDDGEVLGSLVGVLSMEQAGSPVTDFWIITDSSGNPLLEKLESIDVLESGDDYLEILAVADNDKGSSLMLELRLNTSIHTKL
ncbi:hypothetical protein [Cesiribacter sp. SM1]|uniref:DUF6929 family protein n=1 Tax=Cesiribacter sp. SM1 TaxID=2861196 RepID=UPI001CD5F889|nr:hypothetical protein [Cesiribacter sp. SM1]